MKIFENMLLKSRFITFFAVIFTLIGSIIVFLVASYDIYSVLLKVWNYFVNSIGSDDFHADVIGGIIGAIDLYLIALVLLIFSFGVYELFISEIKDAREKGLSVLEVHSLDQLKDKIAKVIIMVLIVNFFQRVTHINFVTPIDMIYFALAILALSLGLYFLNGGKDK